MCHILVIVTSNLDVHTFTSTQYYMHMYVPAHEISHAMFARNKQSLLSKPCPRA